MKKKTIAVLAVILLLASGHRVKAQTLLPSVELNTTPLSVGTNIADGSDSTNALITDMPPGGDWTVTVDDGGPSKYRSYGYLLKLPTSFQDGQCAEGEEPKVAAIRSSYEVKSASPDTLEYGRQVFAQSFLVGDNQLDDTTNSFDYIAPENSQVGTFVIAYYFKNPISYNDFNNSQNQFYGILTVAASIPSTEFTATVGPVVFSAVVSCGDQILSGSNQGGYGGGTPSEGQNTKSPKTGADEVLIALFLVVLLSSSFLIYKALHKQSSTNKLSEK